MTPLICASRAARTPRWGRDSPKTREPSLRSSPVACARAGAIRLGSTLDRGGLVARSFLYMGKIRRGLRFSSELPLHRPRGRRTKTGQVARARTKRRERRATALMLRDPIVLWAGDPVGGILHLRSRQQCGADGAGRHQCRAAHDARGDEHAERHHRSRERHRPVPHRAGRGAPAGTRAQRCPPALRRCARSGGSRRLSCRPIPFVRARGASRRGSARRPTRARADVFDNFTARGQQPVCHRRGHCKLQAPGAERRLGTGVAGDDRGRRGSPHSATPLPARGGAAERTGARAFIAAARRQSPCRETSFPTCSMRWAAP